MLKPKENSTLEVLENKSYNPTPAACRHKALKCFLKISIPHIYFIYKTGAPKTNCPCTLTDICKINSGSMHEI